MSHELFKEFDVYLDTILIVCIFCEKVFKMVTWEGREK